MYSNYRKCHFGQLRTWCVFPALLILAGCALVATLLLPPCTASASPQTASLPAVYQLLLGNDEAPPVPPNTTLSHPIPLTYYVNEDYDDNLRQTRIVQVDDGYWIAYVQYSTIDANRRLFLAKTNREGRTMISALPARDGHRVGRRRP